MPLGVLLEGGANYLLDGAVVPEADHLAALAHKDPPHDVDRLVVPVEQARRSYEADRVLLVLLENRGPRKMVRCPTTSIVGHPTITEK